MRSAARSNAKRPEAPPTGSNGAVAPTVTVTDSASKALRKATKSEQERSLDELIAPFQTPIRLPETSVGYQIALAFVALVMCVLPLLYVALIGAIGWATFMHASTNYTWMSGDPAWPLSRLFGYVSLIVVGAVIVLFMLKPIFARRSGADERIELEREAQPELFAFIDALSEAVDAPEPCAIYVDARPNASAGFRRGLVSTLRGELELTIGLTLVTGLSLREFAGVMAHELGHFSQGAGMFMTAFVERVNLWFRRAVYERDAWDDWVKARTKSEVRLIILMFYLVRLGLWLTRAILWVFMTFADILCARLLREMEYDADRIEAQIAGSASFARTTRKIHLLSVGSWKASFDLQDSWRAGRLADDYPAYLGGTLRSLSKKQRETLMNMSRDLENERGGWFASHPSAAQRIANVKREDAPGVYQLRAPATILFRDYAALSRQVTLEYYRETIDESVTAESLYPTDELLEEQRRRHEGRECVDRFFAWSGVLAFMRFFLDTDIIKPPPNPRKALERLRQARRAQYAEYRDGPAPMERLRHAEQDRVKERLVSVLRRAEVSSLPVGISRADLKADPAEVRQAVAAEKAAAVNGLERYRKAAATRLATALGLLEVDKVAARLSEPAAPLRRRARELVATLGALERAWDSVLMLRDDHYQFGSILAAFRQNPDKELLGERLTKLAKECAQRAQDIAGQLGDTPYPYEHSFGGITIGAYALQRAVNLDDPHDGVCAADRLIDNLFALYERVIGDLITITDKVETAVGFKAMPVVEAADTEEDQAPD